MRSVSDRQAMLSRRRFLAASSGFALGLGLGTALRADIGHARSAKAGSIDPKAWEELRKLLPPGAVLRRGEGGFESLAEPNNLRYDRIFPDGIARCSTARD